MSQQTGCEEYVKVTVRDTGAIQLHLLITCGPVSEYIDNEIVLKTRGRNAKAMFPIPPKPKGHQQPPRKDETVNKDVQQFFDTFNQLGDEDPFPDPVFVSGDVKAETLVKFLGEVKHLVEAMASQIVEDPGCINEALSADRADLIREATSVVESESWNPLYFMIDKSRAEGAVWPQIHIRLCQFHVVQAILRWETDQGLTQPGRPKSDRTASDSKVLATLDFWQLQRAHDRESWDQELGVFLTRMEHVIRDCHIRKIVLNYFEVNWFTKFWLGKKMKQFLDFKSCVAIPPFIQAMLIISKLPDRYSYVIQSVAQTGMDDVSSLTPGRIREAAVHAWEGRN
ncbi:hypothetical protein K435DRAFT_853913 [Dendrothele bispora CBS 962.96]|uniref:MULE transposase domain-containing protein n=1 Tax=Dendrothele bispora (strain CBS 962.96) TaxID=1314807 RepID=A0A4S8MFV5_DENBC|nr:hypothetical protein K435DRAFT_853913 [Dendrothele bispora CBS 962.96]